MRLVRAALLLLLAAPLLPARAATPEPHAGTDARLQAIVDDPAMPLTSLAVVALRQGKIVYAAQFGTKRLAGPGHAAAAADAHTLYRVASLSKMVTALGVLRLVEQGVLELDADVSGYLGYRLRNPHFPQQPITLRMLLSHTSSLRDGAGYSWEPAVAMQDVLLPGGALYGSGAAWSADAAPGTYFSYVNLNWGVIAGVMESATGERFDRLMRRLVLAPLDLRGGFYPPDFTPAEAADLATLYRKRSTDAREIWDPAGPWIAQADDFGGRVPAQRGGVAEYVPGRNGSVFGPQGGLRISAAGLATLLQVMVAHGRHGEQQFLHETSLRAMEAMQWRWNGRNGDTDNGLFRAWGLGLQHFGDMSTAAGDGHPATGDRLVEGGGWRATGHLGDAWGLKSAFLFDPASGDGMIYIVGGVGADPQAQPGRYSSLYRFEERILSTLYGELTGPAAAARN